MVAAALFKAKALIRANDPGGAVALLEALGGDPAADSVLAETLTGAYRRDARYGDAVRLAIRVEAAGEPGEQLLYERAMAELALGRAAEALASFDRVLAMSPNLAAAWFWSHAPALDLLGWDEARRRLTRAAALPGANRKYTAFLAAYAALMGGEGPAYPPAHRYVGDGVTALAPLMAGSPTCGPAATGPVRLFGVGANVLRHALAAATGPGLVLEFGVRRGTSIAVLAQDAGQDVHGFDSFEGLPEAWVNAPAGVLTTGGALPAVPANVHLHAGWFEDTLPPFLAAHPGPVRLANIDSDLYSSARTVLRALADRLPSGAVLVFDEMIGNRTWRDDEYRAFQEHRAENGGDWAVIALSLATKQVALRRL